MNLKKNKLISYASATIIIVAGIGIRYSGLRLESLDMQVFLYAWYDEILENGFASLREAFSNYTPPYLYLLWIATKSHAMLPKVMAIKSISIFFDLCNSFLIYKIIRIKHPNGAIPLFGSATFLILPTILLNSSFWGQADAIYACFLLASILCLLKNWPLSAMVFFGISLSFKAQAVFLSPLLLLLIVRRRVPWFYLGAIPAMYIVMMIPAMLAGRPMLDLITIYLNQANETRSLSLNAPNLYVFISNDFYTPAVKLGILFTVAGVSAWTAVYARKIKDFTEEVIIFCAFVSAAIVPFLLPKMHDRYFYIAEILALITAFYFPRLWFFALGYQVISGMMYYNYLLIPPLDPIRGALLTTSALANTTLIGLALAWQWRIIHKNDPSIIHDVGFKFKMKDVKINLNRAASMLVKWKTYILFTLILALGIFARVWEFGALPSSLHVDEASIGTEAYYLYKFGMDRNGVSYPVHLISWGSGQNALYAYMILPLVALKGINTISVRLPMMIAGILSLPLIYISSKRLFGNTFALTAMLFMAISPWHIVNSRWAVESNIFPFFFLTAFTCLTLAGEKNKWLLFSSFLFGLCLYAYGTAYLSVPIFLLLSVPVLLRAKQISISQTIWGAVIFFLTALPILLFISVNTLKLDTIQLGLLSIPRLPVEARYESMAAVFGEAPLKAMAENSAIMLNLLWTQTDAFPWNYVEPFGYFYKFTFPLALAGFFLTIPIKQNQTNAIGKSFIFSWMVASVFIGIIHPVNLTRINLIFTPILFCIVILLTQLDKRIMYVTPFMIAVFLIGFSLFTLVYHGEEYKRRSDTAFNAGIIPAINYATQEGNSLICFTEEMYSAYIYVLLTQKFHPSEYVDQIEWINPVDPINPARTPRALKQFRFRLSDCEGDENATYILTLKESPPNFAVEYRRKKFVKYLVFLPK